jgi:hypothetical protein
VLLHELHSPLELGRHLEREIPVSRCYGEERYTMT